MNRDKIYSWSVVAVTAAILAALLAQDLKAPPISTFVFWIVLLVAVELLPVSLGFGTVTMSFPIYLALTVLFEPWVAMLIGGIGAVDPREFRREISPYHALFNRAQSMLAVGLASWIFGPFRDDPAGLATIGFGAALAAAAFTIANLAMVSVRIHLRDGIPAGEALRGLIPEPAVGFWISYAVLASLGVATAVVYREIRYGAWAVAAFLIPLLFARLSIQGAKMQQELSERVRLQQQALLEATEKVFDERENERKRIAEEIHDGSLQLLAAAAYGCSNAEALLGTGREDEARKTIATSKAAMDEAITSLRASLVDLRRSSVEEGGLLETINKFAEQARTLWGVPVTIEGAIRSEPPLPVALAAFQILQEGMTNSLKHAQSSPITVRIGEENGMVHIIVEDQGPGFDPAAEVSEDHVGMRLMRERAARVGGSIKLDASPGAGTRLEAILPGGVSQ